MNNPARATSKYPISREHTLDGRTLSTVTTVDTYLLRCTLICTSKVSQSLIIFDPSDRMISPDSSVSTRSPCKSLLDLELTLTVGSAGSGR